MPSRLSLLSRDTAEMSRTRSLRYRFSTVFSLVLLVVIVLGSFSIWRLADYYTFSAEIRDRFFWSTQYIGDLNNYTSDFRAAEATALLSSTSIERAANAKDREELDRQITWLSMVTAAFTTTGTRPTFMQNSSHNGSPTEIQPIKCWGYLPTDANRRRLRRI
jgi:hypothetical protein